MSSLDLLLTALHDLGIQADDVEIAETYWLASHIDVAARAPGAGERPRPGTPEGSGSGRRERRDATPSRPAATRSAGSRSQEDSTSRAGLYPLSSEPASDAGERAVLARAPAVTPLPRTAALNRALRPLKRKVPSPQTLVLDEEATADRIANEKLILPVLRPERQRWLSLALVAEATPSMDIWRSLVKELVPLMERLGAFRDVRLWYLHETGDGALGLRVRPSPGGPLHRPSELVVPHGRQLTLVVTDGVDAKWRAGGPGLRMLDQWGRHGPTALLQPLPQRLWARTHLAPVPARLHATEQGLANRRLLVDKAHGRQAFGGVPVPVLEIEPEWLGPWARLVTATGAGGVDALVTWTRRPVSRDEARPRHPDDTSSPAERVMRLRAASPEAYRLAGYLSVVPLNLPIMRLVQRVMLPESRASHLAEVFNSGLLRIIGERSPNPEETRYDFEDGVREVLQGAIRRSDAIRVIESVETFVTQYLGRTRTADALLSVPGHAGDRALAAASAPFASISTEMLYRLGGDYAELARARADSPPSEEPHTSRPSAVGEARKGTPGPTTRTGPVSDSSIEHVEAVVVGSGYGGAVAAYRLAEAGRSVVLLERGRPFPPGTFPRSPAEMGRAFWDPIAGLHGMFDVWRFAGCDSIVAAGLGGGSLVDGSVLLRKDERWFVEDEPNGRGYKPWPVTRADLDPHYDVVERMMGATPYPLDRPPYDDTPKAHAMFDAAAELDLTVTRPPLAVSFAPTPEDVPGVSLPIEDASYGNLHGGHLRRTCRLCGECIIGCNDGAKNSLDHTYLSAAKHHGADIRTHHEVKAIRPRPDGGYEVDYLHHDVVRQRERRIKTISCDRLVLAAGTYGTTFLLLKSSAAFPGLSPALGTRFCGNGDLLTFLLRARDRNRVRPLDASRGPVVTTSIRLPDERDGVTGAGRGAYIQDGGYPGFMDWMVQSGDMSTQVERAARFIWGRFAEFFRDAPNTNLSRELSDLIGDGALSISSLPLLGMGRDTADGRLSLKNGRLVVDFTGGTSEVHYERLRRTMQGIADVLGADYSDNPIWFRKRVITIHPLGGAPMGDNPHEAVCDAFGEVFGFPGLYIADGAAMPGPVGPNPALTIAALADRLTTRLLEADTKRPGG
ncbi:SAV_2336 N-terminal domain-related protein [Actinomadura fulvescens]|uniref:Cholesterol oxidase n=1 Tax=Actinomadura fulvescens TaxID=46160 RepID=A0ABP6D2C9_9ACTN